MPQPPLIGAHLSTSKGLAAMLRTGLALGANCAQMFTSSPQQWRGKTYTEKDIEAFAAARAEVDLWPVVSHESYLINLASSDAELLAKSRTAFRAELERCGQLGLPAVVIHWGSYKGYTLEEGLCTLAASLNEAIAIGDDLGVQILLETTAGQGSYLGGDFAHFPRLLDMVPQQQRLGVCLDTCHVFVAGYDLRDDAAWEAIWTDFDRTIGLDRLQIIHVNDTQRALGSHGDRHANLGEGVLGVETFRRLMTDPRLARVPKIIETPGDNDAYARDLALLRGLAE